MERQDVVHEVVLKLLNIGTRPLATGKLFPRFKQIFDGDDTLVGMSELPENHINEAPPPAALAIATESEKRIPVVVRLLPSHSKGSPTFTWAAC